VSRWIVFDQNTVAAICKLFGSDSAEILSADPLTTAVELSQPCVVVLPSSTPGKALLAYFRPSASITPLLLPPLTHEAIGFLGLSDVPVLQEEALPLPPKKHWWQRKAS
jgi:hypothetical protein